MSFSAGISLSSGNLNDSETKKRISFFFDAYFDKFKENASKTNIGLANFSLGKPNNYYFAVDRIKTHFIFSSDFAGGIKEVIHMDLRSQKGEKFPIEEISLFFRSQKGFSSWRGFSIETSSLNKPDAKLKQIAISLAIDHVKKEFQELIQKHQPLFISISQVEAFLDKASEDELTQLLLVPLLKHLGFNTAEAKGHKDKTLEFGQDIQRIKIQIPTGHWLYFSAQVKKGNIKANTKTQKENVNQVLNQTASQLEWEMPDSENNSLVKPDHILLIVSGDITEAAKQFIFRHSLYKRKRVLLWEKQTILKLCSEKGLPEQVQKIILEFNKKHQK